MEKVKFIISELITIIIQYFLICVSFLLFTHKLLLSLYITLGIFTFHIIIVILTLIVIKKPSYTKVKVDESIKQLVEELVNETNKKYNYSLIVKFIKIETFGPAWITGNVVFVNTKYLFLKDYFLGIVAHELGHYMTKVCKYSFIDTLKPGAIIARIFRFIYLVFFNLIRENKKRKNYLLNFFYNLFYYLYILFSIFDIILIFPILKQDEINANSIAAKKLGKKEYGNNLRCYYGACCLKYWTKADSRNDIMHPSINKMIDLLNKELNISEYEKNIFYDDKKMYYAIINTKTYTLPNNIKTIEYDTMNSDTLIKLNTNECEYIERKALNNLPNIEILIMKNVKTIHKETLMDLKKLKEIHVYNDELKEIIESYNLNVKIINF